MDTTTDMGVVESYSGSVESSEPAFASFDAGSFEGASFEAGSFEGGSSDDSTTSYVPLDDAFTSEPFGVGTVDDPGITISGLTDDPFAPEAFGGFEGTETTVTEEGDDEDWNQALSMLSPKAAQAVAAASEDGRPATGFDDGVDDAFRGA
jgi:hypothetical protein